MAQLPVFRRFSVADVPDSPQWLEGMYGPLNLFCEQTVDALNKKLTIGQNIQGQKYTQQFTTPADYLAGEFTPMIFAYSGFGQPNCCFVGQINKVGGGRILNPVSVTEWVLNINRSPFQVVVNYIAGLEPSTKYNVTLLVL